MRTYFFVYRFRISWHDVRWDGTTVQKILSKSGVVLVVYQEVSSNIWISHDWFFLNPFDACLLAQNSSYIDMNNTQLSSNQSKRTALDSKPEKLRIRAKAVDCIRARRQEVPKNRESREITSKGYSCHECEKFALLLRGEYVSKSLIADASKHRFICAPTSTPQNIWEPWTIPLTNSSDNGPPN